MAAFNGAYSVGPLAALRPALTAVGVQRTSTTLWRNRGTHFAPKGYYATEGGQGSTQPNEGQLWPRFFFR